MGFRFSVPSFRVATTMTSTTMTSQLAATTPASATTSTPGLSLAVRRILNRAMADSDSWVVEFEYADSKGQRTRRTVSPIRFCGSDRFLALCLCREEPRQFHWQRCDGFRLIPAAEVIMPVPMQVLS